jgi:hypothetical protein
VLGKKLDGGDDRELAALEPSRQIVLDGKTLRASAGSEYPALHLLAAYCPFNLIFTAASRRENPYSLNPYSLMASCPNSRRTARTMS